MNGLKQLAVTDESMLLEREEIIDQLMQEYSDDILHQYIHMLKIERQQKI